MKVWRKLIFRDLRGIVRYTILRRINFILRFNGVVVKVLWGKYKKAVANHTVYCS